MNKSSFGLSLIAIGMAIAISCNTVLASMFAFANLSQVLVGIGIAGLFMLVISMCFTELFSMYPGSLAIRAFSRAALGDSVSIAFTLLYALLAVWMGAFEAQLLFEIARTWLTPLEASAAILSVFVLVVLVNLRGLSLTTQVQVVTTLMVVGTLLLLGGLHAPGALAQVSFEQAIPVETSSLLVVPTALFLFVGVEWACFHATGKQTFARDLPRAQIFAVATIVLVYSVLALGFGGALDAPAQQSLPHLALAPQGSMTWYLAIAVSVLALVTSFNVGLAGASRILYGMAREGVLPAFLAKLAIPSLTPTNAVLVVAASVGVLVPPMLWLPELRYVVPQLLTLKLCVAYLVALVCWLRLRRGENRRGVNLRIPAFAVVLVAALLGSILAESVVEHFSRLALMILGFEAMAIVLPIARFHRGATQDGRFPMIREKGKGI